MEFGICFGVGLMPQICCFNESLLVLKPKARCVVEIL